MNLKNKPISGIFLIKRSYGNTVSLENEITHNTEVLDYFEFEKILRYYFDLEKTNKILDIINCSYKVIIDFDKNIAKRIKEKDYNFNKAMNIYFNPNFVQEQIDNVYEDIDNYIYTETKLN